MSGNRSATGDPATDGAAGWGAVATVLRIGTVVSVAALGIGLAWSFAGGSEPPNGSVLELITGGGPDALIAAGLLALTLVPIAMLVAVASVFARLGERRALVVTLAVLLLLLASLAASAALGG